MLLGKGFLGFFDATKLSVSGTEIRQNTLWRLVLTRLSRRLGGDDLHSAQAKELAPPPTTLVLVKENRVPGDTRNYKNQTFGRCYSPGYDIWVRSHNIISEAWVYRGPFYDL